MLDRLAQLAARDARQPHLDLPPWRLALLCTVFPGDLQGFARNQAVVANYLFHQVRGPY